MCAILSAITLGLFAMLGVINNDSAASPPEFLYKIITINDWTLSQSQGNVILPPEDDQFIHFSTKEQLSNMINKYWWDQGNFYVLKIRAYQLPGKMVKEANPGGTTEYYHLYGGRIPLTAVVEAWLTTSPR